MHCMVGGTPGTDTPDNFGMVVKKRLLDVGIKDVHEFVNISTEAQTGVCIVLSSTQDRGFVTHHGATGLLNDQSETLLKCCMQGRKLMDSKERFHIHLGGFFSCTAFMSQAAEFLQMIRIEDPNGEYMTVSLDTNCGPACDWGSAVMEGVLAQVDVFLPNETEALAICKALGGPHDGFVEKAALFLATLVRKAVVVTCGADGALIAQKGAEAVVACQALPGVQILDPTGCGDAFNAGFLQAWLQDDTMEDAVSWGSAVAAACGSTFGASSNPASMEEVRTYRADCRSKSLAGR